MKKTNPKKIEEFIRVDHAGERGAIKIYEGQLLALSTLINDEGLKKTIKNMKKHEEVHCNFFEEFSGCTAKSLGTTDKQEILKSLNDNITSCKDVNFKLFGISLAGINLLLSLLIVAYSIRTLIYEKN